MNTSKQVNMMVGLLMVFLVGTLLYFLWDDDRASEADVRRIFGHAGYRIVDDPARLAAALTRTCAELIDGR